MENHADAQIFYMANLNRMRLKCCDDRRCEFEIRIACRHYACDKED